MGVEEQKEILRSKGISDKEIDFFTETDNAEQPKMHLILKQMRPGRRDTVEVTDLHRLSPRSEDMADFIDQIIERNGTVIEWRDGELRSTETGKFAKAVVAASMFLSGRRTAAAMSRVGKLGAAASPLTKRKSGVMPLHEIQAIYNDHSLSVDEAYAKYYADKRYTEKVSPNTILRWARKGEFLYNKRPAGGISRKPRKSKRK